MSKQNEHQSPQPLRIAGIDIAVAEQSPLVLALSEVIRKQEREIQELRNEVQRLKKTTRRPKVKPSCLLKPPRPVEVDSHLGPALRGFILLQCHQNHVTQGRLLEQLREVGVDVSAEQESETGKMNSMRSWR